MNIASFSFSTDFSRIVFRGGLILLYVESIELPNIVEIEYMPSMHGNLVVTDTETWKRRIWSFAEAVMFVSHGNQLVGVSDTNLGIRISSITKLAMSYVIKKSGTSLGIVNSPPLILCTIDLAQAQLFPSYQKAGGRIVAWSVDLLDPKNILCILQSVAIAQPANTLRFKKTSVFSNYYEMPVSYRGLMFGSSEAAYHSAKFTNPCIAAKFTTLAPQASKDMSRQLSNLVRSDWETVKLSAMQDVIVAKCQSNPSFSSLLKETKNKQLVEDTSYWHDNYWGDCLCPQCQSTKGQNHLGKILMKVRNTL